jgi:fatty-acyl-CoA synthase
MRAIDYFDKGAEAFPSRTAIIDGARSYAYSELSAASHRIARAMWARGLRGEEPAAIYSTNDARVLFCMLGLLRAGAVWVPINYRNGLDANAEYMRYAGVSWLFYHSSFRESVRELQARVPNVRNLVCVDAEDSPNLSLESFMASAGDQGEIEWADACGNPLRRMGLVPTGGTTGPAKGVMVTNLSWGAMVEMAYHYWRCEDLDPVCLSTAPLSHAAGTVAFALFMHGAKNIVLPRFDALEVLRSIERYRVTHIFLPPTAFYALLSHPDVRKFDYSSLRIFLLAASPVSPDKFKLGVGIFGPCMCQCYGQTEAPMLVTWLDPDTVAAAANGEHPERLRSCGRPTSAVRVAIMNDDGLILPPGETGEIVVRGNLVGGGYYNLPEASAEARAHGWHHTGDVGYRDQSGFVYIVDRKKDMIITGGFNVYSAEVESAIMELAVIRECAVIGVPDEHWGEAVKAIVVLRDGESLNEGEIIAHCKARLGGVKSPKSVEFRSEILKTHAGKTDKRSLRKPYWEGMKRGVH